jgi:CBS domain-containing protein
MAQSIQEVMTRGPECVEADDPLSRAAELMKQSDIGAVIVTQDGEMCGLVTDRDIIVRAIAEHRDPESTKVRDVASTNVETLSPDASVDDAIRIVREHNVRRVPVVDGGKPVGIVSIGDLAIERDKGSALADMSAAPSNN